MAGLGAKLFTAFSKLTAAQVNGYLMDQSIMRFASVAARDAAFGGAGEPTLAEGMTCYLDDTNVLQSYTGSAWVSVAASQTTANVSNGLVYVAGGTLASVPTFDVTGFSTDYVFYEFRITVASSTPAGISAILVSGTTLRSTGYYGSSQYVNYLGATGVYSTRNNAGNWYLGDVTGSMPSLYTGQISGVGDKQFNIVIRGCDNSNVMSMHGAYSTFDTPTSFDKIRFTASNSATLTGSWSLMGVRKP